MGNPVLITLGEPMNNQEDENMQVMTKQAAVKRNLWQEYIDRSRPAVGTFQHFQNEEARQQHLREVEEAQRNGAPF